MMIPDFYTKTLQVKLFRMFYSLLLNLNNIKIENIQAAAELDVKQSLTKENSDIITSKECVDEHGTKLATYRRVNEETKLTSRNTTYGTRQLVGIINPMPMRRLKAMAEGTS